MIRMHDAADLPLTARNQAAIDACLRGLNSFNQWRVDAMSWLDEAIVCDDEFALPLIVKAWMLHLGRSAAFADKVAGLIAGAEARLADDCPRQRRLLDALKKAHAGDSIEAATLLECNTRSHPTDLFSHRLVQFELFWNGRAEWMREIVEAAAPAWREDTPGYGDFLSCRAFSNEEAGAHEEAEQHGRAAVEIRASDPWGAHAVAHVLIMQGRIDDGVNWLESLCENWDEANQIKHHLWWHLALFLLERGEHARILELLTGRIRDPESPLVKAAPEATIDLQNVASMLLRLELRGVDVGDGWQVLGDICNGRVHDHANAFSNAHDMMVLAATAQFEAAEALLTSAREFAAGSKGIGAGNALELSYASAGVALCDAILAHRRGELAKVITSLSPVRHDLPRIGGSHAQRDLFYQILIDAAARLGRADLVAIYLREAERIGFIQPEARTLYREVA